MTLVHNASQPYIYIYIYTNKHTKTNTHRARERKIGWRGKTERER